MLQAYYQLAKPGIIYGNILTTIAGYLLASRWHIHWLVFVPLVFGMALVIGGACAFNNYLDRGLDKVMERTRKRPTVSGRISGRSALVYATVLSAAGLALLLISVNFLTVVLALVGLVDYVVLYGFSKRRSVHGTLVGCISGSVPLVAGYTAVSGRFDAGAWLLFLIMVCWQMAHFYAIALYRLDDYKAVKLPVMPAVYGAAATKIQIIVYVVLFMAACAALSYFGYAGAWFAGAMAAISLGWLYKGWRTAGATVAVWGRSMFLYSLLVILGLSALLSVARL